MLRINFVAIAFIAALAQPSQADLFGITNGGELIRINTVTGAGTLIGNTGLSAVESLENSPDGRLLAIALADDFYEINPVSAVPTFLGDVTNAVGVEALAYDSAGVLFASVDTNTTAFAESLATVNDSTAIGTIVGPFGQDDVEAMAFLPDGTLVGSDLDSALWLSINPVTGVATTLGSTGLLYGLEYFEGRLYATQHTGVNGSPATLVTVDPATGALTTIGPIGFNSVMGLAAIVPESSTITLVLIGVAIITCQRVHRLGSEKGHSTHVRVKDCS